MREDMNYKSKWHLPYKVEPIKGKDYNNVLIKGVELIESLNMECWLSAGTMLGIYRDGKPIDEDTDLDVGMMGDVDIDKLIKLFVKNGFNPLRTTKYIDKPMQVAFVCNDVIFDIYFYYKENDVVANYNDHGWMYKPLKLVKPLHKIKYLDKKYNCPNPKEYCEWRYGKDWKTPNRNSSDWSQMRRKKLFDNLKYSVVMPLHKMNYFTDKAIKSVLNSIGDRDDVEFLVLDDSEKPIVLPDMKIQHIKLPQMDLINKLIIGTQLAKGKYYCNSDYDDLSHPKKFEFFDELLKKNDIAGAAQCVFFDAMTGKSYKPRSRLRKRVHKYKGNTFEFPWLQHSNSAIPLKWLRKVGYGTAKNIGMAHAGGSTLMTDSPIWAKAKMDNLKVGFFEDIEHDSWKQCYQIIHSENVNKYTNEMWRTDFISIKIEKPEVMK